MHWRVSGEYIMGCTCSNQVHWPIDGSLSDRNGACDNVAVFRILQGDYDGTDLAGVKLAIVNFFPPRISSGDWRMGVIVDPGASLVQFSAAEIIVRGVEGGPFSAVSALVGDYMGADSAGVGYLEGDRPFGAIEGRGSFSFRPTLDKEGKPLLAPSAMYVFAEEYRIGRSEGKIRAYGKSFSLNYGEYGRFSFTSENTGMEREFRPTRLGGLHGTGNAPPRG